MRIFFRVPTAILFSMVVPAISWVAQKEATVSWSLLSNEKKKEKDAAPEDKGIYPTVTSDDVDVVDLQDDDDDDKKKGRTV